MSCQKHGYTNNAFCPECDIESIEVNSMTTDTPKRFREVEPLRMSDGFRVVTQSQGHNILIHMLVWDVSEARALRDWLTRALPPEYCECKPPVSASSGAYCCDCGHRIAE